jgi:serine/threonine-protein kinase
MAKKGFNQEVVSGLVIVIVFVGLSYLDLSPFDGLEKNVYDAQMKWVQDDTWGAPEIVLVDIDDKSTDKLGSWPWPRHKIAEMIDILKNSGARLIGINLPFTDREVNQGAEEVKRFWERFTADPLSSKDAFLSAWVLENLQLMEERLDNDSKLVESVKESGNVILPVYGHFEGDYGGVDKNRSAFLFKNFLASREISQSLRNRISATHLSLPFPDLAEAASGVGHANLALHKKMAGRSHTLFISYMDSLLPSFPLRLAIAYLDQKPDQVIATENHIRLNGSSIPIDNGEMLVRFRNPQSPFPRYSFVDMLQAERVPSLVEGKIALIAFNCGKNRRIYEASSRRNVSEGELIASILDNLIHRRFIAHPSILSHIQIFTLFFLGGFASFLFPRMREPSRFGLMFGLSALTLVTGIILLVMMGIWFKTMRIVGCLLTIYLVVSVRQLFFGERMTKDSREAHRLLGLGYQSQGLLDLAFDRFKRLPLDNETKDLIYNLGVEYERRRMIEKAVSAYEYVNKGGGFKDLGVRIPKLKESDETPALRSHGETSERGFSGRSTECRLKARRYQIIHELGKGSMGVVYKALDTKINRLVAIKTIRFSDEFDDDVIQEIKGCFLREAEIAGQLSHPSIVTIFDVGEDCDLTYVAMEYLEGDSLEKFTNKENLLPFGKVLNIVAEVAGALDFAHRKKVIHRGIKPANIMLLTNGGVKVTDFGIDKAVSSSRTKTGLMVGTPNYMSPEQIMGQKIDGRSDIFSLGILFFQLLTGELPFHGKNMSSLLYQITEQMHPSVRNYNPKIPKACKQIIDRALAKNANERIKTPGEMAKFVRVLAGRIDRSKKKILP